MKKGLATSQKAIFDEKENNNIVIESVKETIALLNNLINNSNKDATKLINSNIDVTNAIILEAIKE